MSAAPTTPTTPTVTLPKLPQKNSQTSTPVAVTPDSTSRDAISAFASLDEEAQTRLQAWMVSQRQLNRLRTLSDELEKRRKVMLERLSEAESANVAARAEFESWIKLYD